ncbi:colanic acid biosynthesis glycosyltransferase WcaL [Pelagibius litoralis]|uniref:Colanic acid biosynthesis glycosyltransferase WcaL n=1 Tax=Pelagibius litoralis TaxID=374515 RepID=A0A967EVE3_9PROT|nr:glycosyltransferase [Pelagibius litoralis]NIA67729.1 colanic acid biosynthesis glycosyltransferase WcaL [Pelagibius litoralis]
MVSGLPDDILQSAGSAELWVAEQWKSTRLQVAFFTNAFPMMSEPFIALSAASLIDRGHDVDVYGLSNVTPTGFSSAPSVQAKLRDRFRNAQWPLRFSERMKQLPTAASDLARRRGIASLPIWKPGTYRRNWSDLTAVYQARVIAEPGEYDILHCQFATLAEYVVKHRRAGILKGRLVVHFRGYDISEVVQRFGPDVYDYLWSAADRFIANCDHFKERAIALGCPADKIDVVGSGIDLQGFAYQEPRSTDGGPVQCLTVGRLTPRKGIHIAIEALRRLVAEGCDINLAIVGDGEQRRELEEQASAGGLGERVKFLGSRPHSEIQTLLEASHIFIAASLTSSAGGVDAPVNTIKEAMAVGVPTCATDHGGIPELVEEGSTGVLARENDPASLAAALRRLLAREANWPTLSRAGRLRVERDYGNDIVTDKLLKVYEMALADRAKPERMISPVRAAQ